MTADDRGYVVLPSVFNYTQKGVPMSEAGQMIFTLKRMGGHWLITAWTWGGSKPQPAAAAK